MTAFGPEVLKRRDTRKASAFAKSVIESLAIYNKKGRKAFAKDVEPKKIQNKIKNGAAIFIVKNKGKVVGFIDYYPSDTGVGWIDWLLVDPAYRRKEIGTMLTKHVLGFARKHGEHAVWADTRTNNSKSIRLIKKLGFRKIGTFRKAWYGQDFYLWYRSV